VKTLVVDIETSPNTAHTWGLWNVNVGLPQLLESGRMLCFAAKWEDEDKVMFHRGKHMVTAAHKLLDQADAVVTWNGNRFDLKWFQSEFIREGMTPPSPFVSVDLCAVVKRQFAMPSNKLDYWATQILGEGKAATGGHHTWIGCMAGDKRAWARMREYNIADVMLTERLFLRLKPYIKALPSPALYGDTEHEGVMSCPQCGSHDVIKRGLAYTALSAYTRYSCKACARWFRGKHRVKAVDGR
jgi:RNase_H superfamily